MFVECGWDKSLYTSFTREAHWRKLIISRLLTKFDGFVLERRSEVAVREARDEGQAMFELYGGCK
jgi:hypothetical protein